MQGNIFDWSDEEMKNWNRKTEPREVEAFSLNNFDALDG